MSIIDDLNKKHEDQINNSRRRRELAYSFREPDTVPVAISVSGSYFAHMFGFDIKDEPGR